MCSPRERIKEAEAVDEEMEAECEIFAMVKHILKYEPGHVISNNVVF